MTVCSEGKCSISAFLLGRRAGSFISTVVIIIVLFKLMCRSYWIIWGLSGNASRQVAHVSHVALSFLSVHNNIFCSYCEGWSSTFALESGRLFLEACRVLLPFLVPTAEMPVTLVICCLSCKRGETSFCLLSHSVQQPLGWVSALDVRKGGAP